MKLINGRGQLGDCLKKYINEDQYKYLDWIIYHTWNVEELNNEEIQKNEFNKFKDFIDNNKDKKICFISTSHVNNSIYILYKIKAEAYIIDNVKDFKIIRPPRLIGKGIFQKFKEGELPWDDTQMDLMTIDEATIKILDCLEHDKKFNYIYAETLSKTNVYNLIQYGSK